MAAAETSCPYCEFDRFKSPPEDPKTRQQFVTKLGHFGNFYG